MTFVDRFILVIGLSVAITLLAIVGAAFVASEQVSEEIEQARVSHLIGTLRSSTEANLSIGLDLDEISQLQATIEREKANDPAIMAIDVFDAAGRTIYSTDRGILGETVEKNWIDNLDQEDMWRAMTAGDTVFGTRFENDFGVAGGIAVTISGAGRHLGSEVLGMELALQTLLLGAGAFVLSLVCAFGFTFVIGRPFMRAAGILNGHSGEGSRHHKVERLAAKVREAWGAADARLARGTQQLKALDDAE